MSKLPSTLAARFIAASGAAFVIACLSGCGSSPSAANIKLRKENQTLNDRIVRLERQHDADAASIDAARGSTGSTSTLSPQQLEQLFTVHDIKLKRLTGEPSTGDDRTLRVYAVPTDGDGDTLKAAGSFIVEAYALSREDKPLIGKWTFDAATAKKLWSSGGLLYEYVLPCPWQSQPSSEDVTLRVTFTDELSRRSFTAQKVIKFRPAASTAPAP